MVNSINVTQNKWTCITQLKGRSCCLCISRCCSLPSVLPAPSLVRGFSRRRISVWLHLHQALAWAAATQNHCFTAKGVQGKQTGSFVSFRWSTLLCVPACFVCRLQCHWPLASCWGQPGDLTARGALEQSTPSFHGFTLCSQLLGEDLAESCSWQPLPRCPKPHCRREGRFCG